MWLLIHAGIKVKPSKWKGAQVIASTIHMMNSIDENLGV